MRRCESVMACGCRLLVGFVFLAALMVLPAAASAAPPPAFSAGEIVSSDGGAVMRWEWNEEAVTGEGIKGVKVYRLRTGDETVFRGAPVVLVKDCGMDRTLELTGLTNGEQYVYFLHTYDAAGAEKPRAMLLARPGTDPEGVPQGVKNLYAVGGHGAVGLFWDQPLERDVVGYELARKAAGDAGYTVLARFPRYVNGRVEQGGDTVSVPVQRPGFFRDTTLADGFEYRYRLRVADSEGNLSTAVETGPVRTVAARSPKPDEVLLLVRGGDGASMRVARQYARKRGVPEHRILEIDLPSAAHRFRLRQIEEPLRQYLLHTMEDGVRLAARIRVIVPCFGIPLRGAGRSVDSMISDIFRRYTWGRVMGTPNPMFRSGGHFDPSHGLYMAVRLDGPDEETAAGLTDKALQAEKTLVLHNAPGLFAKNKLVSEVEQAASRYGVPVQMKPHAYTRDNDVPQDTVWFYGVGHAYRPVRRTDWPAGAVAAFLKSDTLISLSSSPPCWAQGFLEQGVTATFGAVAEPYVEGYTRGDVFFDRFWSGKFTFAEAMFMATPTVRWMMSGIGDPLYRLPDTK